MSITILDNGASTIKYGDENTSFPKIMPNCIARVDRQMTVFVGDQIYKSLDGSLLRFSRPFDCGYLTNWACEIDIWNYLFNNVMKINTRDQSLVITEPPFNLDSIQNDMTEVIFEEYNFQEYMRRIPAWFTAYELAESRKEKGHQINGCLVIDSGFSFSHSLPLVDLHLLKNGVSKRIY
jgi:actin-related protein 6